MRLTSEFETVNIFYIKLCGWIQHIDRHEFTIKLPHISYIDKKNAYEAQNIKIDSIFFVVDCRHTQTHTQMLDLLVHRCCSGLRNLF